LVVLKNMEEDFRWEDRVARGEGLLVGDEVEEDRKLAWLNEVKEDEYNDSVARDRGRVYYIVVVNGSPLYFGVILGSSSEHRVFGLFYGFLLGCLGSCGSCWFPCILFVYRRLRFLIYTTITYQKKNIF
jgi:hypothetical protein